MEYKQNTVIQVLLATVFVPLSQNFTITVTVGEVVNIKKDFLKI